MVVNIKNYCAWCLSVFPDDENQFERYLKSGNQCVRCSGSAEKIFWGYDSEHVTKLISNRRKINTELNDRYDKKLRSMDLIIDDYLFWDMWKSTTEPILSAVL